MKILVTGASGFIGRRFVNLVLSSGVHEIVSLGEQACGTAGVREIIAKDITSRACEEDLRGMGIEAIVHLAAAGVNPADRGTGRLIETNAILPSKVVEMASRCGIGAVVMSGSCSEYLVPDPPEPIRETVGFETTKLYGSTKAAGGMLALAVGAALGVRVCVGRIFNAYGPGEAEHRLLPSLIRSLSRGERASMSTGEQVRDFVFVDDICEGLLRFATALSGGEVESGAYNICTGIGTRVADMARMAARAMGKDEALLGFGDLPMRPDEYMNVVGDPSKTKRALNWMPATSVEDGIGKTIP
jgi:nucleoside-diphosphate-sugar epimerase